MAESPTAGWRRVALSSEIAPRGVMQVTVEGVEILVVRLEDGGVAACQALCPHRQGRLAEGSVYMGAIDCPLHHYLYDLRTGQNRYPANVFPQQKADALRALHLYRVEERDGGIWVTVRE